MALITAARCEICGKIVEVKEIKKDDRFHSTDGWVSLSGIPADLKDEALHAPYACADCAKSEEFQRRKTGDTRAYDEGWYG